MSTRNLASQEHLPTFQQVRRYKTLTLQRIAQAAGVHGRIVACMERGIPVEARDAERVLTALSRLSEKTYSLQTVQVSLTDHPPIEEAPTQQFPRISCRPSEETRSHYAR